MIRKLLILLAIFSIFHVECKAQNSDSNTEVLNSETLKVKVSIYAMGYNQEEVKDIKLEIENRLKTITNVSIVDDDPQLMLLLYIVKSSDSNINKNGCSISISHVSYVLQQELFKIFIETKPSKEQIGLVQYLSTLGSLEYTNVIAGDNLSSLNELGIYDKIVETFRIKQIERSKEILKIN